MVLRQESLGRFARSRVSVRIVRDAFFFIFLFFSGTLVYQAKIAAGSAKTEVPSLYDVMM